MTEAPPLLVATSSEQLDQMR